MISPRLDKWNEKLKTILDEVDDYLEDKYGSKYRLHPARPKRDTTSNKSSDGLFNLKASFTLGIGSKKGKGYALDIHLSTLDNVDPSLKESIKKEAIDIINKKLPQIFPSKELKATIDGNNIKIYGDLSL